MSKYRQNPRTADRVIDGVAFVVTPDQQAFYTLNGVGTRIWQLAARAVTLDEIVGFLIDRFDVPSPEQARADAAAFCAHLVARGMFLEETEPDASPEAAP
jgi:coenzyme PQQ synthesis protein D (PqqD)